MSEFEDMSNDDVWILVEENLIGTQNQCIALADALGTGYTLKNFILKQPWKSLSPFINFGIDMGVIPKISAPFPKILIAAGRKAIAPALWIKKMSKGHTFVVFIMNPKVKHRQFDLIIAPSHDELARKNVVSTLGSLSAIREQDFEQERVKFARLEKLQTPRIAVLIGGNSKTHSFTQRNLDFIIDSLKQSNERYNASFMITCSRRTPPEMVKKLRMGLDNANIDLWDGRGPNPYKAYLAYADFIFVTSDSVSMISEAVSTGKPTYLLPLTGNSSKFDKFYKHLFDAQAVKYFDGTLENWGTPRLNEVQRVAEIVKERYLNKSTKTK